MPMVDGRACVGLVALPAQQPALPLVQPAVAGTGKRPWRIGIVALARRLAIALRRYLEQGEIPDGAILKPSDVDAANATGLTQDPSGFRKRSCCYAIVPLRRLDVTAPVAESSRSKHASL
jgi:hypothetical protein